MTWTTEGDWADCNPIPVQKVMTLNGPTVYISKDGIYVDDGRWHPTTDVRKCVFQLPDGTAVAFRLQLRWNDGKTDEWRDIPMDVE